MKRTAVLLTSLPGLAAAAVGFGCVHAHVDPIEVKPITLNVNVNIRQVDQSLDQFFAFEQQQQQGQKAPTPSPAAAPASQPGTTDAATQPVGA